MSRTTLVILALLVANSAAAHDTWIVPHRFHLRESDAVALSVTSGMEFPKLDHAIKPDRVAEARSRAGGGETAALPAPREAAHALTFRGRAGRGVTAFWVVLHPRPSQLKPEQVREYVEHLGIANPEGTIARWQTEGSRGVAYRYVKYAKTFVRAASTATNDAWRIPAGMRLELMPESDPTRLSAGSMIRFVLVDRGKPIPRYPVSVIHRSTTKTYTTDEDGRVTIDVASGGPYLVRATTLERSAAAGTDWDVHFTTLTFEAHSRR